MPDIEEVAPGRFVLNNPQLAGLVKREGEVQGRFFMLTSWRGDGLMARLRERGFSTLTLADAVAALPPLPRPLLLGAPVRRTLGPDWQLSRFDGQHLQWVFIALDEPLPAGLVVRRRRKRGVPLYGIMDSSGILERGETTALLEAYAQAADAAPLHATLTPEGERWRLPNATLPTPHRTLLRKIAPPDGQLVDRAGRALAVEVFAALGVELVTE